VRIVNTLIRDNQTGVQFAGGVNAVIAGSKILANAGNGILVSGATAAINTTAVSDSGTGIAATGSTQVAVARSTITNNGTGVSAQGSGATVVTVSSSMVTGNTTGLAQSGTATLELLGNNTVRQNTLPSTGMITTAPRM
jgi:formaldehyde-activating enzyme involved in methanogenesis